MATTRAATSERSGGGGREGDDDEISDDVVVPEVDQTEIDELMTLYFSSRNITELGDEGSGASGDGTAVTDYDDFNLLA